MSKKKWKDYYVCKLMKSLYRLKQVLSQWYKKFEFVVGEQGYKETIPSYSIFEQKFFDGDLSSCYSVNDMLIVSIISLELTIWKNNWVGLLPRKT